MDRRDEVTGAVFSLWVVAGLFLDGWAHNAEMVETFWTPWHAVLYSGFFAGGVYATVNGVRARRQGLRALGDPLIGFGFLAFLLGGMGDTAWHSVFGIEEDLEALLSPTHLLLMIGGLLLTTGSARAAWARPERAPWFRTLLPALTGVTLAIAVVAFFLQFASPFRPETETFLGAPDETEVALAVTGMLLTTVLLFGATFLLRARWELPPHALLFVFTGFATLMSGLHGFRQAALIVPAALAGALTDALLRRGASVRTIGVVAPSVLWLAWFGTYAAWWGLDWAAELWTGAVVFAGLTGLGLSYLTDPPRTLRALAPTPEVDDDRRTEPVRAAR